jgi:hypothetical protein
VTAAPAVKTGRQQSRVRKFSFNKVSRSDMARMSGPSTENREFIISLDSTNGPPHLPGPSCIPITFEDIVSI